MGHYETGQGWPVPPEPRESWGRTLWRVWCIMWAVFWAIPGLLGLLGLVVSPTGSLVWLATFGWITFIGTPLSLFAMAIGGRRQVEVVQRRPVVPPFPTSPTWGQLPAPPPPRPQLPPGQE